jgi:hypothetical protein
MDWAFVATMPSLNLAHVFFHTCWFGQSLTLGCVGEFVRVARALIPIAQTSTSCETINVLQALHPSCLDSPCPYSLMIFSQMLISNFFLILLCQHSCAYLICQLMAFKTWFLNMSRFLQLRRLNKWFHLAPFTKFPYGRRLYPKVCCLNFWCHEAFNFGHTLRWCLIDSGGIWLITISETFYHLMNRAFCLHFHDMFFSHLLPQQFCVIVRGRCEVVVHSIQAALNVHLD